MNLETKIKEINTMIENAKFSYINKKCIDDNVLEFKTEDDLNLFIDSCNYEKVGKIKMLYDGEDIDRFNIGLDDKRIIHKVIELLKIMPEELHDCIGCPCFENSYPACENCSFQESCLSGDIAYPEGCDENDCFYTFLWVMKNESIIKESLDNIGTRI